MSLSRSLEDWVDLDLAQLALAKALGLMSESTVLATEAKRVFWSNHPIGELTYRLLGDLEGLGALERRDEPDIQFRWNAEFKALPGQS